jgi:hypothetical protein
MVKVAGQLTLKISDTGQKNYHVGMFYISLAFEVG